MPLSFGHCECNNVDHSKSNGVLAIVNAIIILVIVNATVLYRIFCLLVLMPHQQLIIRSYVDRATA